MNISQFAVLMMMVIGVVNASSETVKSDSEAKQLIPALDEIEVKISTDGQLGETDNVTLRKAVRLWSKGISSMDIRPQFWVFILSAARKKSPVVLEELVRIVQTQEIDNEIKCQAIFALGNTAEPAYLSIFEKIAKDTSQRENARIAALNAIAYIATPKSQTILEDIAKNESSELLVKLAQTWKPIAQNIMIARDKSLEWATRREAIKYLSENLVPSFASVAIDNIMLSDPKHADEIKEILKKGDEIVLKKLIESGELIPRPVKP